MTAVTTTRRFGVNAGMAIKVPCVAATTANITLAAEQTIDGVAVVEGDRVLVKDQTDSVENGIYDVSTGSWRRSPDFDAINDVTEGTLVGINNGTVNGLSDAKTMWRVTTTGTITPGTTAITFILAALGAAGTTTDLVAHDGNFVGSGISTVQERFNDILYITDFAGVDKTGATDSTVGITAARDYIAANPEVALVWPGGIYSYSVSPNWAIANAHIIGIGDVRLRYTGSGNAFILDGGAAGAGVLYMDVGPFLIEGHKDSGDGVYIRAVHHARLHFNVRGCGTTAAAIRMLWCVVNEVRAIVSVNEGGWYDDGTGEAEPLYGVYLDRRGVGETCAYNTFINPILEGTGVGAELAFGGAVGNSFYSGTMEACVTYGVNLVSGTNNNKFFSVDFEANGTADIQNAGAENSFIEIDSDSNVNFINDGVGSASESKIIGGGFQNITIGSSVYAVRILGASYSRASSTGAITDNGTDTVIRDAANVSGANIPASAIGRAAYNQVLAITDLSTLFITSPTTYMNDTGFPETIIIQDGSAVTDLGFVRSTLGTIPVLSTSGGIANVNGFFDLSPGDGLAVTFSSTPTIYRYTR